MASRALQLKNQERREVETGVTSLVPKPSHHLASSPGHSQTLSCSHKIWEWPGDEATHYPIFDHLQCVKKWILQAIKHCTVGRPGNKARQLSCIMKWVESLTYQNGEQ